MEWSAFQSWLMPAALVGLATVIWDARNRLETKHAATAKDITDRQDAMTEKVEEIREMMRTELRTMDVRIARIEAHIWPREPRQ